MEIDYTLVELKKLVILFERASRWDEPYMPGKVIPSIEQYMQIRDALFNRIEVLESIEMRLLESMVNYSESQEFIDAFHYILEGDK